MRGERVLGGRRALPPVEGEATNHPLTDEPLLQNQPSEGTEAAPPQVHPQIVSEARLGAEDLINLGRLSAPKTTLTAFVDHDLYQRIQTRYVGGITKFVRDAIEQGRSLGVHPILLAEKRLSDRRAGTPTTTLGARVPAGDAFLIQRLTEDGRKLGVPNLSKNSVVSGLVMLHAESLRILNDE